MNIKFSNHNAIGNHSNRLKSTINACMTAYKSSSKLDNEGQISIGDNQETRLTFNRAISYA